MSHGQTEDDECPGEGKCHGCVKWCDHCGEVDFVCDTRLEGGRCDEHPVPPEWGELRERRREAEQRMHEARQIENEARRDLEEIQEDERARRAYALQLHRQEDEIFGIKCTRECCATT